MRLLLRLAREPWARLACFLGFALAYHAAWLWHAGLLNDFRDNHLLQPYEQHAVDTLLRYHQLPLWDPYDCGGLSTLGAPQSRIFSPTFLLSLVFGAGRAAPLACLALSVAGMEGFFRWARLHLRQSVGPFLLAPLFATQGFFALSWVLGWIQFEGFQLLPWVLFGLSRVLRGDRRGQLVAAVASACMLGFGGTYAVLMTLLCCVPEMVAGLCWLARRSPALRRAALFELALSLPLLLAVSAARSWPLMETLRSSPRVMGGAPANSLGDLAMLALHLFPARVHDEPVAGQLHLGAPLVALGLLGLLARGRRKLWAWMPVAVVCTVLATGHQAWWAPFALLRRLPLFSGTRYPERYLVLVALYLALLGAGAAAFLLTRARWRTVFASALWLLLLGGYGSAILTGARAESSRTTEPAPVIEPGPFHQARGNRWGALYFHASGLGTISCGEAYEVAMSPLLRGDLPADEYLAEGTPGEVGRIAWTPNHLALRARLPAGGTVLVNQNWDPGWTASAGRVVSHQGLLAVELPPGTHELGLAFRSRPVELGLVISALGLVASLAWAFGPRRTPASPIDLRGLALALLPFTALALWPLWSTPPAAAPVLRNPDGTPLFEPVLPADARPLAVRFAEPIVLRGITLPTANDADGVASLALHWEVEGALSRDLGIFVHLENQSDGKWNKDHDFAGNTLLLHQLPISRGAPSPGTSSEAARALVRDAFAVSGASGHVKIYLGLWHARGDQARVPILDGGGAKVDDGRVLAGEVELGEK
jgi:hypothetical protein